MQRNVLEFDDPAMCRSFFAFLCAGRSRADQERAYAEFALNLSEAADAIGPGQILVFEKRGFLQYVACVFEQDPVFSTYRRPIGVWAITRQGNRALVGRLANFIRRFQRRAARGKGFEMSRRAYRLVMNVLVPRIAEFMACVADDRTLSLIVRYVARQAQRHAKGEAVSVHMMMRRIDWIKTAGHSVACAPLAPAA